MATVKIEIGVGEALDRLSILKIKCTRVHDEKKKAIVTLAYFQLESYIALSGISISDSLYEQLLMVNEKLWDLEDYVRTAEPDEPDEAMIVLGKYYEITELNDKRARLKQKIDKELGSDLTEVKSYE